MDISYVELHMNYLCKMCKMYVCIQVWGKNCECAYFLNFNEAIDTEGKRIPKF